jgi:hypothetical protein
MERKTVHMVDPVFGPGTQKTAVVPCSVSPAGTSVEVELFLGPSENIKTATSGRKSFTSTGSMQNVSCPITMPVQGGLYYHVYIDLWASSYRVGSFVADEDVIIPTGQVGNVTWT